MNGMIAGHDMPPENAAGALRIVVVRGREDVRDCPLSALPEALADPRAHVWIDVAGAPAAQLAEIAEVLGLHPLVTENIIEQNQRAKVEQVDQVVHLVLFGLVYEGEVRQVEIDFVLGERFLLTVHDGEWDLRSAPHLRPGVGPVLARGADYLLYALCDWIVDAYFPVMDRLADELDTLQDEVVERATRWTLERLFVLKRELISVRRATSPAREIFNQLTNRELGLIRRQHVVYFRDVYDHLIRVTEELDNYRELVSGTLDVYLSTVNNNLSAIMKRLTAVTVILAGMGAIAGIFGMSEAGPAFAGAEAGGFWIVAAGVIMVALAAALVLRRMEWI
jgi:magnesium transporter